MSKETILLAIIYLILGVSFCGKTDREVRRMITGPDAAICNECVEAAREIIQEGEIASAVQSTIANDLRN